MSEIPEPWAHQLETVRRGKRSPIVYDCSDPGTGKTRAHLMLYDHRARHNGATSLLVLCPKPLMVSAWQADIKKYFPDLRVSLAFAQNRKEALAADADVYIVNLDGVKALQQMTTTQLARTFGDRAMLVVDEVTAYKTPTSQRTKAMHKLAHLFPYRSALTGTPNPNSVVELWAQVYMLDAGQRLGDSFYRFRNSVQHGIPKGAYTQWVDKPDAEEAVFSLIDDIVVRHEFDEVMNVPPIYDRFVDFDLPPKLLDVYRQFKETALLEYANGDIVGVNAAVQANKLLQIASGVVYNEAGSAQLLSTDRAELIYHLAAERDASIVFFSWKHQRDQLTEYFDKRSLSFAVIDGDTTDKQRAEYVDAFQNGKYNTLLMHPKTGAHGLTLTKGRAVIWASPRYEADYFKQGIHRVRRGGQTMSTENIMLCANDTVERAVYERRQLKSERMDNFLDLVAAA